jgi:hypothetical protein
MFYRNLASALAILVGVIASLGCCCPGRLFRPPQIVVQPPPIVVQPPGVNAPPPVDPGPDVQQFLNQNLGANKYAGTLAPNSALWNTLRQKVVNRKYTTNNVVGGGFGNIPFSEVYANGGVLIGFVVSDDGNGHVGYLQPVYLTAQGEKAGQGHGVPRQPLQCFKAKTGYAVGGFKARIGGLMDAFAATFMKVEGERLSLADKYDSPTVGGQGGGPTGTQTSALIVGIHGKRLDREGSVTGLGFYTVP